MDGFYSTLTVSSFINASSISTGYLFADTVTINKASLSSIQFISTLLFQDPNTTSLFSMGLQTNKTDTFPQGTVNSSTTALSLLAPNTNFGLYMGVNDSGVAYIMNLSSSDTPFSTIAILAEDVVISSLLVSSINGQLPGSGSVGPELAVSTLTASTISTGSITTENASVSSFIVSSINGQAPGFVSPNLVLSTLQVSSILFSEFALQVSTASTVIAAYALGDTQAIVGLQPQSQSVTLTADNTTSTFTIQQSIDGSPTGSIQFTPSSLMISSAQVVVPTALTAYSLTASTVSSGNAFIGETLYANKGRFGPQIDVLGAAENRYPHMFEGFPNTDYTAKVSTLNYGEYRKLTTLSIDAYDASVRYLDGFATGMEYFHPSTGFSFRVGSESYDVNNHQLQISSQQVFVRSELFTSSLIVSSINGQQPGGGSVGPTLELSTLAVSSISSIFINTDVLNANSLNVSSFPGSAIQAFSLPWSKMQQTGNLTVYAGTWTHGGTLSVSNLSVSSSYTVNDLRAKSMLVDTTAVVCSIIAPAISTIFISAASAYFDGIVFDTAYGNTLNISNVNVGTYSFVNLDARNIVASTATLSSLVTNTLTVSSIQAIQGISTARLSTGSIYADSISTYSMSVFGSNTLTVSGNAYFTKEIVMSSLIVTGQLQVSTTGTNTFDTANATISSLTVSSINGSAYPNMQFGTSETSPTSTIVFNTAYTTIPSVVATPIQSTTAAYYFLNVSGITTSNFTAVSYDSNGAGANIQFTWMSMGF